MKSIRRGGLKALRRLILFKQRLIVSPTKVLSSARRNLSALCVHRLRVVRPVHVHGADHSPSRASEHVLHGHHDRPLAREGQVPKTPVPQGVSHLCAESTKTVGPLGILLLDFKQGDRPHQ